MRIYYIIPLTASLLAIQGCTLKAGQTCDFDDLYYNTYAAMASDPSKALELSDRHIKNAYDRSNTAELSKAFYLRGYIYDAYFNNPQMSLEAYLKSVDSGRKDPSSEFYLNGLANIGELYFRHNYVKAAIEVFDEGLKESVRLHSTEMENRFNMNLVTSYLKIDAWMHAWQHINRGILLTRKLENTSSHLSYLILDCATLTMQKKYTESIDKLLAINTRYDSMSISQQVQIFNNLGINYLNQNSLETAENYLQKAFELNNEVNILQKVTLINLGTVAYKRKELKEAERFFKQAEGIPATSIADNKQIETYEGLVNVYTAMNKPKLVLEYKQKSLEFLKPVVEQMDHYRTFAGMFKEWQNSREVTDREETAEAGIVVVGVALSSALILLVIILYRIYLLRKKLKVEGEIRLQKEINEFKDAIIYNIRMLY